MLVYTLPNIVLAVTSDPAVAVVVQVVRGAGTLVVDVLAVTALQRAVAPDVTARVFGVFWALILGAIALGALVAPVVVAVLGLEGAIVALAVAPALLALLALPELARMDRAAAARTRRWPRASRCWRARACSPPRRGRCSSGSRPRPCEDAVPAGDRGGPGGRRGRRALRAARRRGLGRRPRRRRRELATIGPGGWFGELGLLEGVPRTATVTTTEPSGSCASTARRSSTR